MLFAKPAPRLNSVYGMNEMMKIQRRPTLSDMGPQKSGPALCQGSAKFARMQHRNR
jgi:hypothetical protein